MKPGDSVWIVAFDDVPRHRFVVREVHYDHVTGFAVSGPLAGAYGEPDRALVEPDDPQGTSVSL